MRVLGIESTCDETGVSIVDDGTRILSNVVLSQVPLHERFGGVVPEIASRAHVEAITRMVERAFAEADLPLPDGVSEANVDAIAVANRPGLVGSLLVGVTAAKSLSLAWNLPLVAVDHVQAHVYSVAMGFGDDVPEPIEFPAVALIVSGGHTSLYLAKSWTDHELIGSTMDDAAGEAFDKASAILGLGYPGGPAISKAAVDGDPKAVRFPRTLLEPESLDFSFSGIKTSVLYHVKGQNARRATPSREISVPDTAASFEQAVCDVLTKKVARAVKKTGVKTAVVGGGVAANGRLRRELEAYGEKHGVVIRYPALKLCTDNGAMIAGLGDCL
ncbi:MAG: tRNA (adenosine(37)-N6)-threonylcarbamoyltransferase complex transferase subunit TsaD, partial [Planctomycetota bacterium]